jgi:hypothetical protein
MPCRWPREGEFRKARRTSRSLPVEGVHHRGLIPLLHHEPPALLVAQFELCNSRGSAALSSGAWTSPRYWERFAGWRHARSEAWRPCLRTCFSGGETQRKDSGWGATARVPTGGAARWLADGGGKTRAAECEGHQSASARFRTRPLKSRQYR